MRKQPQAASKSRSFGRQDLAAVIPTRNTAALTLACLHSLAELASSSIVVVDDASDDGSPEVIRQTYPEVRVVTLPRRVGFAGSANRGVDEAEGSSVLLFLNSDTELKPEAIDALLSTLEDDPALGIAGAQLVYPGGRPQWSGGAAPSLLWLVALASGLPSLLDGLPGYRRVRPVRGSRGGPVYWVSGTAMAVRREVWEEAGPFDEGFQFYCQDLDLCLRARRAGWGVGIVPGFRVVHHQGATIGREKGAVGRSHPEFLWADLLRWCAKHRKPRWIALARVALLLGGCIRILCRSLAASFVIRERRPAFREESALYRKAMRTVWEFSFQPSVGAVSGPRAGDDRRR